MYVDSHEKMTDSLERILIEREANAMRGAAFAQTARMLVAHIRRLGAVAIRVMGSLRTQAKDKKVDYAAG